MFKLKQIDDKWKINQIAKKKKNLLGNFSHQWAKEPYNFRNLNTSQHSKYIKKVIKTIAIELCKVRQYPIFN